jgi:hypothetical protein
VIRDWDESEKRSVKLKTFFGEVLKLNLTAEKTELELELGERKSVDKTI